MEGESYYFLLKRVCGVFRVNGYYYKDSIVRYADTGSEFNDAPLSLSYFEAWIQKLQKHSPIYTIPYLTIDGEHYQAVFVGPNVNFAKYNIISRPVDSTGHFQNI